LIFPETIHKLTATFNIVILIAILCCEFTNGLGIVCLQSLNGI
jgi:hypothetical protein